jgi:dienelactone hydrolase
MNARLSSRPGTVRRWCQLGVVAGLLLAIPTRPQAAPEGPPEPFEEIEAFTAGAARGILVLPAGAPDRRTPAVVILDDTQGSDGRASRYTDQLLGAGFAVLKIRLMDADALDAVLDALTAHSRVGDQPVGLLAFGEAASLAAPRASRIAARALLHPGCAGFAPAATRGESLLVMHGAADPANAPGSCAELGRGLAAAGAAVRLRAYDGTGYAWDRPSASIEGPVRLPRPDGEARVTSRSWPDLPPFSAIDVARFFATSLLGR